MKKVYAVKRAEDLGDGWELTKFDEGQAIFFTTYRAACQAARFHNGEGPARLPKESPSKKDAMWK
jgi:hypothetical protein